jgi:hypothetical protein
VTNDRLAEWLQIARGALVDIATPSDMTLGLARMKTSRIYGETDRGDAHEPGAVNVGVDLATELRGDETICHCAVCSAVGTSASQILFGTCYAVKS